MSQFPFKAKQAAGITPIKAYDEKKRIMRPGTAKNPVKVSVQTQDRHDELAALCADNQWSCDIIIDEDQAEDLSQIDILRNKPVSVTIEQKVGRNDPCVCGSGKKYKKCCALEG